MGAKKLGASAARRFGCGFAATALLAAAAQAAPPEARTVAPAGAYSVLTLKLAGGGPDKGDLTVSLPLRDGKPVGIPFAPELKEAVGHVTPMAGNARGRILAPELKVDKASARGAVEFRSWGSDWGGGLRGGAMIFSGRIDATRDGTRVSGTYEGTLAGEKGGKANVSGALSGSWLDEADLAKANAVAPKMEYPSYYGDGDHAMPPGPPMLDDLSKAAFVWRSEEWLPTGSGSTSRGPVIPTASCNGLLGMPIVKDGAIYISYFIPSGDAIDNAYKAYVETKKGDDPLLYWLTTQAGRVSADDVLAAIDPATGKTLWRAVFKDRGHNWQGHKGGPANLTPVAADGKVFFAGSAGVVYAVDAKTGQALWEHTPACAAEIRKIGGVIYAVARQALGSPLMYADGVVVSYEYGGRLWNAGAAIGLDAQTGRKLWALPGLSYLNRCTLNGKTYFLGGSNQTSCIEPKTGKVLWKVPCAGVPVARGDRAFMQESETQYGYYKLSPQGAERLWSATLPKTDLNNSNDLVSLNATHALLASVPNNLYRVSLADGKIDSVTAGGHNGPGGWVAGDRYLYHSDCKHGNPGCEWYDVGSAAMKQLWTGLLPHPGTTSYGPQITCLVIDGRIYRRGKDGIYCFDARKR